MDRRAFLSAAAASSVVSASAQLARAQTPMRFGEAARYSADNDGASLLVARYGVVLAENYPAGPGASSWPIGAGTRAFAPLLVASLVKDELLTLDEFASMTLGEWGLHPIKSTISIRTILNGTSGIAFAPGGPRDLATALAIEPVNPPGVSFSDDAAAYLIITEIARRKLAAQGGNPDPAQYLQLRTLMPIGCNPVNWQRSGDGSPRFDDGASVSARGWAQAGELIRRAGIWRAQQLADDNALREAVRGSVAESRAGFGLWLAVPSRAPDPAGLNSDLWRAQSPAPIDLAMAAGAGGQRLYIAPMEGLVIVRQARSLNPAPNWSDAQLLSLLWRDL